MLNTTNPTIGRPDLRSPNPERDGLDVIRRPVVCARGHRATLATYDVQGGWFRVHCDCGAVYFPDGDDEREFVESPEIPEGEMSAPFPSVPEVAPR